MGGREEGQLLHHVMNNWARPPSRTTGLNFLYIHVHSTHIAHARAMGKRKASSLQVQRSHVLTNFSAASNSANGCSLSTTDHS